MSPDDSRRPAEPSTVSSGSYGLEKKSQDNTCTNTVVVQAQQQIQQMQQQSSPQQNQPKK